MEEEEEEDIEVDRILTIPSFTITHKILFFRHKVLSDVIYLEKLLLLQKLYFTYILI